MLAPTAKWKRDKSPAGRIPPRAAYPAPNPVKPLDDDFFGRSCGVSVDQVPVQMVFRDGRIIADVVRDAPGELMARRL